jgi:ABC-2 type transport system permease protein
LIGQRVGLMGGVPYMQYIAPGLIMMAVITNSYGNVVSSFFGAKFGKHVEEMLVAPLPNWIIILGYVGGGLARGFLVGGAVTIVSLIFTQLKVHHAFVIFAAVILTSVVFSLGGFINAQFAKNFDQVNWIPTFVLTPLTYFGGRVLFHLAAARLGASPVVRESHPAHGERVPYGFLGTSDVNVFVAFSIMLLSAVVLFAVALTFMNRGTGMRE